MKLFKIFLFSLVFIGIGYLQANGTGSKVVSRDLEAELCAHIENCDSASFDGLFTWYLSRIEKARRPGLIKRLEECAIKVRDEKRQLLYKGSDVQPVRITHEQALKTSLCNKSTLNTSILYGLATTISGLVSAVSLGAFIPIPPITTAEGHVIQFSVTDKARAKARIIAPSSMIMTGIFAYLCRKEISKVKKLAMDISELDTIIAHINEDHEDSFPWAYPLGCELMMVQP